MCGIINLKNHLSMGHLEPMFIYDLNPLIYSLVEKNSHIVLKTLFELQKKSSIFFEWTTEILLKDINGRDIIEVDLIANIDGELYIGECKSNSKISLSQIKGYVALCKKLKIKN
jgi:hypothetical protein